MGFANCGKQAWVKEKGGKEKSMGHSLQSCSMAWHGTAWHGMSLSHTQGEGSTPRHCSKKNTHLVVQHPGCCRNVA